MEEIELIEDEIFKRMELIKYCENKINVLNSSCEINKICEINKYKKIKSRCIRKIKGFYVTIEEIKEKILSQNNYYKLF